VPDGVIYTISTTPSALPTQNSAVFTLPHDKTDYLKIGTVKNEYENFGKWS
jgi:hypothetical protein